MVDLGSQTTQNGFSPTDNVGSGMTQGTSSVPIVKIHWRFFLYIYLITSGSCFVSYSLPFSSPECSYWHCVSFCWLLFVSVVSPGHGKNASEIQTHAWMFKYTFFFLQSHLNLLLLLFWDSVQKHLNNRLILKTTFVADINGIYKLYTTLSIMRYYHFLLLYRKSSMGWMYVPFSCPAKHVGCCIRVWLVCKS